MSKIANLLPDGGRILEIGAGTGQQAKHLQEKGFDVEAVEIPSSDYAQERIFPITDYDGLTLPFEDATFDAVFSSNVLEHVPDLSRMHSEIRRVLRPGGVAVHAMPTHSWRFWTILTTIPTGIQRSFTAKFPLRALASSMLQKRHGERGNVLTEFYYFQPRWWLQNFAENDFIVVEHQPVGLFYTGNMLIGSAIPLSFRGSLSRIFGSACHIFKVIPMR